MRGARSTLHAGDLPVSASLIADEAPVDDVPEDVRLMRGLAYGLLFSLPLWGAIVAVARLAF